MTVRRKEYGPDARSLAILLLVGLSLVGVLSKRAVGQQDELKDHYLAGAKLLAAGDHTAAEREFKAFLAGALHRVANAEAQAQHFDEAFRLFQAGLDLSPADKGLRFDFATVSLDAERFPQAKASAEELVRSDPRDASARFLLGRILFGEENYRDAKTQLEQAVALNPDFPTGYLLGKTYLLLHDEASARKLFDEMVAGLGDTALLHTYFGRAYSLMDYPDRAIEEFHKAIARDSRAHDVHYYLGLACLRHDESAGYDKAIPEFQAELKVNPEDPRSHYMLGYIALKQRRFAQAEPELIRAAELQPNDVNTLISLAEVYSSENRVADAETNLRKAISVAESQPDAKRQADQAHYLLGRLLVKSGQVEEGKKQLHLAAANGGEAEGSGLAVEPRMISSGSLAQQESHENSRPGREQDTQQAEAFKAQIAPPIAESYNNLGAIAALQKDYRSAVKFFEDARTWNPALDGLDKNLGMAAFYAGEYEKASPLLQRYLSQHPEDATVRGLYEQAMKKSQSK